MKRVFILLFVLALIVKCSDESNGVSPIVENDYREIAYNSLSEDWFNADVESGNYGLSDSTNFVLFDNGNKISFAFNTDDVNLTVGQKLIGVTFNISQDDLLGPIILIIEPESKKVIGWVLRM